jgi:aspartyl-tRNA(Asn)/glutamyl-tRNA(Gln) amidotransferase subunit B
VVVMAAPANNGNLIRGATGDWEVVIGMEVHAQVTSQFACLAGRCGNARHAPRH